MTSSVSQKVPRKGTPRRKLVTVPSRMLVTLLVCAASSGCAPMRWSYEHIEAPDARYYQSVCYASVGPPSVAYYPFHGIFISLDVTNWVALGLHLPAGTTAQLNGNAVRISGTTNSGPVDATIPIKAARHGSLGNGDPREFSALRDPFTSPDYFGPLTGDTHDGKYVWYLFISETDETQPHLTPSPRGLIRGMVELPSITINGLRYDPQSLPLEHRVHTGISSINC